MRRRTGVAIVWWPPAGSRSARRKRRNGAPGRRGQEARKTRSAYAAAAAAARRGLALYHLDMACFAAGRRGREVRRVDGNPHYPIYDLRPRVAERSCLSRISLEEVFQ